jgi:hypothetical protein
MKLGIDIGDTIIMREGRVDEGDNPLQSPFPRAFESIAYLVDLFNEDVFLVSSCTEIGERRNIEWLNYHDFFNQTGVLKTNLRFCRERRLKSPICEELQITHFIDNLVGVLRSLATVPHKYCFNPQANPNKNYSDVHILNSWSDTRLVFPRV